MIAVVFFAGMLAAAIAIAEYDDWRASRRRYRR